MGEQSRLVPLSGPATAVPALSGVTDVLAVVAHPDDESFGLGALLAAFVDTGVAVRLLCLTPGEASTLGAGPGLADRRRAELRAAAARLGLAGTALADYADGTLSQVAPRALEDTVTAHLGHAGAVVVMEPSGVTGHPDHAAATGAAEVVAERTGLAVVEWGLAASVAAALSAEFGITVRSFEAPGQWPVELTVHRDRQRRAVACHVSQDPANPLLRRRLELQGDRELIRVRPAPYPGRLARFVAEAGPLTKSGTGQAGRSRLLRLLTGFAAGGGFPDGVLDDDPDRGYAVHCLHDDPTGWTLATVVTGGGRATPPHDHSSWGAAATVLGAERNIRYRGACPDRLVPVDEQLVPVGGGYLFDHEEIHQAVDASGGRTVSVHLLAAPGPHPRQHCRER